jgi:hypothetical protein
VNASQIKLQCSSPPLYLPNIAHQCLLTWHNESDRIGDADPDDNVITLYLVGDIRLCEFALQLPLVLNFSSTETMLVEKQTIVDGCHDAGYCNFKVLHSGVQVLVRYSAISATALSTTLDKQGEEAQISSPACSELSTSAQCLQTLLAGARSQDILFLAPSLSAFVDGDAKMIWTALFQRIQSQINETWEGGAIVLVTLRRMGVTEHQLIELQQWVSQSIAATLWWSLYEPGLQPAVNDSGTHAGVGPSQATLQYLWHALLGIMCGPPNLHMPPLGKCATQPMFATGFN